MDPRIKVKKKQNVNITITEDMKIKQNLIPGSYNLSS